MTLIASQNLETGTGYVCPNVGGNETAECQDCLKNQPNFITTAILFWIDSELCRIRNNDLSTKRKTMEIKINIKTVHMFTILLNIMLPKFISAKTLLNSG